MSAASQSDLGMYRAIAAGLRGDQWMIEDDDAGRYLLSYRADGAAAVLATLDKGISREELALLRHAPALLSLFFNMIERASLRVRELESELLLRSGGDHKPDYTTQAAMLISDPEFWRFLVVRGAAGEVTDKATADRVMKAMLRIGSKKLLNSDDRARQAWRAFEADFRKWKVNDARP